jgi:hypothetical protein
LQLPTRFGAIGNRTKNSIDEATHTGGRWVPVSEVIGEKGAAVSYNRELVNTHLKRVAGGRPKNRYQADDEADVVSTHEFALLPKIFCIYSYKKQQFLYQNYQYCN